MYVDLSTLPPSRRKVRRKKRFFRAVIVFSSLSLAILALYLVFWPLRDLIIQITKSPQNVLSYLKDMSSDLKSDNGRTNFLVLGIDRRPGDAYGGLTDTIIVASVDKVTHQAVLLSLPRDLWITIPGWGEVKTQQGKINSTYTLGNIYNYPGGGLQLIKNVIESRLNLPIHYALRIDFEGFRKAIDTVGGVTINVEHSFDDYEYPLPGKENADCPPTKIISPEGTPSAVISYDCRFEHLHFEKGTQQMNGETALKFARSRKGTNGEGSDFARAKRQQKVMEALKDKAMSTSTLTNPLKMAGLVGSFGGSVETDLPFALLPKVYNIVKDLKDDNIKTAVLGSDDNGLLFNPPEEDYGGAWVLVPKDPTWGQVRTYVKSLLVINPTGSKKE